jgi:prepilin-type N-terminal cleavage/methylation domain-containing protein
VTAFRRGLSLVELLVVIGILGVLIGLLMPAIARMRVSAHKTACLNNLKNQALATLAFEQGFGKLPPGAIAGPFEPLGVPENCNHGVYACLIGYFTSATLAAEYSWAFDCAAEENQSIARMRIGSLQCPGAKANLNEVFEADDEGNIVRFGAGSHYGPLQPSSIFIDLGWSEPETKCDGALPANHMNRLVDIKDGASNTILFTEQGDRGAAWVGPSTLASAREVLSGGRAGGGPHPGGFTAAFCDASACFLSQNIDFRVLAAMCTAAGGETIGSDQ